MSANRWLSGQEYIKGLPNIISQLLIINKREKV